MTADFYNNHILCQLTDVSIFMDFELARANMIQQQIRPWDVLDNRILETLQQIPRERFMPEPYRQLAFSDTEIPLGHGQRTLSPKVEARILQAVQISDQNTVLEIGTGCGYLTAVCAQLAAKVVSLEIIGELHQTAVSTLQEYGDRIELHNQDAFSEIPAPGSYDVVIFTGAMAAEHSGYVQALKPGGRLFQVIGQSPIMQAVLVTRQDQTRFDREVLFETQLDYLTGAEPVPEFHF